MTRTLAQVEQALGAETLDARKAAADCEAAMLVKRRCGWGAAGASGAGGGGGGGGPSTDVVGRWVSERTARKGG